MLFTRVLRSSLFVVSSRTTDHMIHIPSMQWINTLILCCWNARPLTYYCIIKRLRSETGHAKAGSYHMKPRNGGVGRLTLWNKCVTFFDGSMWPWKKTKYIHKARTKGNVLIVMCRIFWREAKQEQQVGGWGGGGSVSADADSLDVELAQECLTNDWQSG